MVTATETCGILFRNLASLTNKGVGNGTNPATDYTLAKGLYSIWDYTLAKGLVLKAQ